MKGIWFILACCLVSGYLLGLAQSTNPIKEKMERPPLKKYYIVEVK